MHNPNFALDIAVFLLHTELGPDQNHVESKTKCRCPLAVVLKSLCSVEFESAGAPLGSPLNTAAAARSQSPHPPTQRDGAFPDRPFPQTRQGMPVSSAALAAEPLVRM